MHRPLDRRTFLRTSGIGLGLPFLESMTRTVSAASPVGPTWALAAPTTFVKASMATTVALVNRLIRRIMSSGGSSRDWG